MAAPKAAITQAALARVLRAHRDAGIPILRTETTPDGRVIIITADAPEAGGRNPCDRLLK